MDHKIFHMNSFSRSGETLMLRCLDAHPKVHVVHQINEPDKPSDLDLFRFLMNYEPKVISSDNDIIKNAGVDEGAVLVLKNAVWKHKYDYQGFGLVRNPFAVANSFKMLGKDEARYQRLQTQFVRWAKCIDVDLLPMIRAENWDPITCFCALYNSKMSTIIDDKCEFIRYEDFVVNPESSLKIICKTLGVGWDPKVLNSHALYQEEEYGHGGIKLWKEINAKSLDGYKKLPNDELAKIYSLTKILHEKLGYRYINNECTILSS